MSIVNISEMDQDINNWKTPLSITHTCDCKNW